MSVSENNDVNAKTSESPVLTEADYIKLELEDADFVKKGRRYAKIADFWDDRFHGQLVFDMSGFHGVLKVLSIICYLVLGVIVGGIMGIKSGLLAAIVGGLILWVVSLSIKYLFVKIYEDKAKKIWEVLREKYTPLRNRYLEEQAIEYGCTSVNPETIEMNLKEWDMPALGGYIKGTRNMFTYVFSSMDNYGDIIVKSIPKEPVPSIYAFDRKVLDPVIALNSMDKEQMDNGYTILDVGVDEFNDKYRVYTKNEVKARTYFSASMITTFLESGIEKVDYRVFGNNIFVNIDHKIWEDKMVVGEEVIGISQQLGFKCADIRFYFDEVRRYFNAMRDFKNQIENENRFIYK